MSASLHLAKPDDLERLEPLVAAYHRFEGIQSSEQQRTRALAPLLAGTPHGAAYLIGMRRAPVGYIAVSFGYSLEMGGIDGFIDEFYIRQNVRGRGMGTEVLAALLPALEQSGLKALHLEVSPKNTDAQRLYARAGFKIRDGFHLMTRNSSG